MDQNVPCYILIEKNVYAEYQTFLNNRENKEIKYAHVDSINVFHLIEYILSKQQSNPFQTFDRYVDIEIWLKEQWSGFFRELLQNRSSSKQLSSLSEQVLMLSEVNKTLKRYLEELMQNAEHVKAKQIIEDENKRIKKISENMNISSLSPIKHLCAILKIDSLRMQKLIKYSTSFYEFFENMSLQMTNRDKKFLLKDIQSIGPSILKLINSARLHLNMAPFHDDIDISDIFFTLEHAMEKTERQ